MQTIKKNKKYYSPFAENGTNIRHFYPISKLFRKFLCATRCRGLNIEYKEELPEDTPLLVCPNHACDFGPIAMDKAHRRPHRIWSVSTIVRLRDIPMHLIKNVCNVRNKFLTALMFPFALFLSVPMACIIRSQQPIPVYYDARVRKTFEKTSDTLAEGMDVVLYPEWKDREKGYIYVNRVKTGVAFAAKNFVEKYGKAVSIVPVYVCESLKRVIYGRSLRIERFENFKKEAAAIARYIMDEIESIASSLPPHRVTPYDATYRSETGKCNPCAKFDPPAASV